MRIATSLAVAALIATACSGDEAVSANNAAGESAAANATAPAAVENAAAVNESEPAAPSHSLAANGLGGDLRFGLPKARAVELATAAFGSPTGRERIDDCPAGPMEFVSFNDLELVFEDGRFTGWSIDGPRPALRTAQGIGVGDPRSALGSIEVAEDDGMGQGFDLGDFGGYLDESGARVASLAAGSICQFG